MMVFSVWEHLAMGIRLASGIRIQHGNSPPIRERERPLIGEASDMQDNLRVISPTARCTYVSRLF